MNWPTGSKGRSSKRGARAAFFRRVYIAVFVLLLAAFGWGLYRVIRYARQAPGLEVSSLSVLGITRVSEGEVLARSGFTPGASILSLDLVAMREAIEELRWVRHARVQRVWPREIVISVIEREPIALARIDGQVFQVDEDGVILPMSGAPVDSPILNGLVLDDPEANRPRIDLYRATLAAIGEDLLSEVYVSETGEVSVVPRRHPILVDLGRDHHLERWQQYLSRSEWIREEFPGASGVDLRFEGQIIVQPGSSEPARNIPWDEETRRL